MKKVPVTEVVTALGAPKSPLPPQIQEALGELVGAAREGLLALSVGVGLGVVHELMELEVDEVVGAKAKRNPDRVAVRHGHESGSMTLGGRRVQVRRPRMRTADDERELSVQTYEQSSSATGKTAVSDMFVERTRTALQARRARSACDLTDKARSPIACKPGETHCQPARTDPRPWATPASAGPPPPCSSPSSSSSASSATATPPPPAAPEHPTRQQIPQPVTL